MYSLIGKDKYRKYIQSYENIVVFCRTLINEEKNIADIKKTLVEAYKETSDGPIGTIILIVEEVLKERDERIRKYSTKRRNKADSPLESSEEAKEWKDICYKCKNTEYASMAYATYAKMNWKKLC